MTEKTVMNLQKVMGIIVLVITAVYVGLSPDVTAALITMPMGLWLLFTKNIIIQVDDIDEDDEEEP